MQKSFEESAMCCGENELGRQLFTPAAAMPVCLRLSAHRYSHTYPKKLQGLLFPICSHTKIF